MVRTRTLAVVAMMLAGGVARSQTTPVNFASGMVLKAADLNAMQQALVSVQGGTAKNLTLSGTTSAPTAAVNDNSTTIATTAWGVSYISSLLNAPSGLPQLNSAGILDTSAAIATSANGIASRTIGERAGTDVQPQDFLATGQAQADLINNKIDVGALINKAFAAGVWRVHLPCGNYLISTTITMSGYQSLIGDGMCTALSSNTSQGDVLDVAGSFNTVRDVRFVNATKKSGGAVIAATSTFHLVIDHIDIDATATNVPWWNGIALYGANDTHINDSEIRPAGGNSGIQMSGTSNSGRTEDTYIEHTNINGWETDLELAWASGNYLSNMDVLSATGVGILFDPSSSQEVDGTRASQVLSDSNNSDGWRVAGAGPITETTLTNCWGATNGYEPGSSTINALSDGIHILNSKTNNFSVVASEFHANTAHGIEVTAGSNIIISENSLFMNGTAGITSANDTSEYSKNTYYGIFLDTGASNVNVNGNMGGLGGVENVGTTNHQKYLIDSASGSYITMTGNMGQGHWGNAVTNVTASSTGNVVNANNNGD